MITNIHRFLRLPQILCCSLLTIQSLCPKLSKFNSGIFCKYPICNAVTKMTNFNSWVFFCINYFKRIKSKLYAHLKYMYNWGAKKIGYPTGSRPPAILITRFFLRLSQLKYKNYTLFSLKC